LYAVSGIFMWSIRRTEAVVNRLSRDLILYKTWSVLSQCYSKLLEWLEFLEFPEWMIMDNSWTLDAPQISETTAVKRYRIDIKGGEWENTKQIPPRSM
jgi:hypothetical protein